MGKRGTVLFVLLVLLCAACQSAGWVAYKGQGFSLETPAGWKVEQDRASGRIVITGQAGQRAIIWPVLVPGAMDPSVASNMLLRLLAAAGLRGEMQPPRPVANGARTYGSEGGRFFTATFAWTRCSSGAAGFLYVASAPPSAYRQETENIAHVFETFHAIPAATATAQQRPQAPAVKWTRFTDPREHAFTVEAPANWQTTGGAVRVGPLDVRKTIRTVSPDGGIRITGGDAEVPPFIEPNQMLEFTGFREGSWYNAGYGMNSLVRRYVPGQQFAREYVGRAVAKDCTGLQFTGGKDRPDADEPMNRLMAPLAASGGLMQVRSGEVRFTCVWNGQPAAGYYFAGSIRSGVAGSPLAIWRVEYLYGYLARQQQEPQAQEALVHMLASFRDDPQWVAAQSRTAMATSKIAAQTQETVSRMISSTFDYKNRVGDEVSRKTENWILGTVDVVDQASGRQYKVENSSNYYWLNNQDAVAGTDTHTNPGWNFRELLARP